MSMQFCKETLSIVGKVNDNTYYITYYTQIAAGSIKFSLKKYINILIRNIEGNKEVLKLLNAIIANKN